MLPSELISSDKAQEIDPKRLWLVVYWVQNDRILPVFHYVIEYRSGTKFLNELNKSEVFFWLSRKLIERYVDVNLFEIFSITIVLFYDSTMHDSCKNYPGILKLCGENYVDICPRHHMESVSVFIDWLAFIYLWMTILHCPAILHLQAIINRK